MEGAKAMGLSLEQKQTDQFVLHALELMRWNRKINLTAITDPREIAVKHFLDALAPAPLIPRGSTLLDIGSGGGFPGIPLKMVIPSLSVTLIDSSRKKVSFQKHLIRRLSLRDIEARHTRAQAFAGADRFDVIICRALGSLSAFVGMALPLLAEQGLMIALKGKLSDEEMEKASERVGTDSPYIKVKTYELPYSRGKRAIVCVRRGTWNVKREGRETWGVERITHHVPRITSHASRITSHASRLTHHVSDSFYARYGNLRSGFDFQRVFPRNRHFRNPKFQ